MLSLGNKRGVNDEQDAEGQLWSGTLLPEDGRGLVSTEAGGKLMFIVIPNITLVE